VGGFFVSVKSIPSTRKHFPRFFIPPAARELRINYRVSDRGVPYPVLHKAEVCTSVEQVRSHRVFEGVEMPLALRDPRALAIVLHEFIQSAAANGGGVAREEQRGDVAGALFEVGFQGFHFVGLQWVQSLERVLEPVNSEAVLLHVEISGGQHPDFGGAEAVIASPESIMWAPVQIM
jgi:hypothetical protein